MLPLIEQLAFCLGDTGLNPPCVDLAGVKVISAPHRFVINRRKVCCDCGNGILVIPKTGELRVVPVSTGLAGQHCLRQKSFPPESKQALTIQILRM